MSNRSGRKRFGEILIEAGLLTEETLKQALEKQRGTKKRLGIILEEMGIVAEKDIAAALARQFGFKTVSGIAKHAFPEAVLQLLDSESALKNLIFPLKIDERTLYVAMVNPLDMDTIDALSFRTQRRVVPCVTTPTEIQEAVTRHYLKASAEEGKKSDWWRILVVDDQEMVRAAILAILRKSAFNVVEAANGAEALAVAAQQRPHLIITDTVMPRMDGYAMFRHLQAHTATRKIPVIALSSKSAPEEEAKLLDMGFFDFIPKPVNPVRLTARIKRALRMVYGEEPPKP